MTQKHVVIILLILIFVGLSGAAFSKLQSDSSAPGVSPSPTKTVDFSSLQGDNTKALPTNQQKMKKQYQAFPGVLQPEVLKDKKAVIQTSKGNIEFEIYPESPKASSNFIFLTQEGFYDNGVFHRVEGWVIQGGDPTGTGTGGPGYRFEDEEVTREYTRGVVAMANAGPNTNGSQFFILKSDTPLPKSYTIFGNVLSGMEVVDKIAPGDQMLKVTIQPLE